MKSLSLVRISEETLATASVRSCNIFMLFSMIGLLG